MTLEIRTINADDYAPLTFDEAVTLTEDIRLSVADIELKIVAAYFGRAWLVMGYESWDEYVQGEFKQAPLALPREDRRSSVASLRSQGLSMRAIAAVTGVGVGTVHRDKESTVPNGTVHRVTGLDGKERPATRSTLLQETKDTTPPQDESCPYCGQKLPAGFSERNHSNGA